MCVCMFCLLVQKPSRLPDALLHCLCPASPHALKILSYQCGHLHHIVILESVFTNPF